MQTKEWAVMSTVNEQCECDCTILMTTIVICKGHLLCEMKSRCRRMINELFALCCWPLRKCRKLCQWNKERESESKRVKGGRCQWTLAMSTPGPHCFYIRCGLIWWHTLTMALPRRLRTRTSASAPETVRDISDVPFHCFGTEPRQLGVHLARCQSRQPCRSRGRHLNVAIISQ